MGFRLRSEEMGRSLEGDVGVFLGLVRERLMGKRRREDGKLNRGSRSSDAEREVVGAHRILVE